MECIVIEQVSDQNFPAQSKQTVFEVITYLLLQSVAKYQIL